MYVASKFALRCTFDTLNAEIAPFGLRSICFDSGCFRTPVLSNLDKCKRWRAVIDDYKESGEAVNAVLLAFNGTQKGDPVRVVNVIIDVIKGEGTAQGMEIPSGFSLGQDCYETVKESCEKTMARLETWKQVTMSTDYPDYSK